MMPKFEREQRLLLGYSLFAALSALLVLSRIVSSPSEAANAVLLGFSAARLAMVMGVFLVFAFYTVMIFKTRKDRVWAERFLERWFHGKGSSKGVGWLSGISFGLGWIGCFFPAYRAGVLEGYWTRGQPLMILILLIGLATLILFFVAQKGSIPRDLKLSSLKLGLPLFLFCIFILWWMFFSGFGVVSSEDFWYGAGVPILTAQLMTAIAGGVFFLRFESRLRSKWTDIVVCILIYAVTAFLWSREPLNKSFLFTGPSDLGHAFYPFADAATFDTASQFPLIGEKFTIFKSVFFERPLYLSFLVYLHLLFGQNYETLMAVQAGVFAVLPVLIYLIGRSLGVRSIGFGSAMVAMFRGLNSIAASNMIDMANPKMILTDFPTAIGLALIILCMCEWLKEPDRNRHFPIWIGGAIGFTMMLRTNALLLLVFIPFYVFFKFLHERKMWLISSCLILLGMIAITLPWEIRNVSLGGQLYGSIVTKFQNVIIQRYLHSQSISSLPRDQVNPSGILGSTQVAASLFQNDVAVHTDRSCNTVICFVTNHFLHNVLTSILTLPTSPVMDDLPHFIRNRNPYYWKAEWDGSFTGMAPLFLALNLFLITTGIAFAWKEKRLQGLTPLALLIAYHISNGLARTSGGRYIVPVDWIVSLYYLFGIFYILGWIRNTAATQLDFPPSVADPQNRLPKTLFAFAVLLGLGGLIPLSENVSPLRYQHAEPVEILTANRSLIESTGVQIDDLDKFLQNPGAVILNGRALYPRYYGANQGEIDFYFYPYVTMGFPRMAFKLIGPSGEYSVVLPGAMHKYLPHAGDVLVIGCNNANYLDALLVVVLDGKRTIYTRKPPSALQCPLQQPVCNDNSNCRTNNN